MTFYSFVLLLNILSVILSIAAFVFGARYRRQLAAYAIPILVLAAIGSLTDVLNLILAFFGIKNLEIFHFYSLVEITLWTLFYALLVKKRIVSIVICTIGGFFILIGMIEYVFEGVESMNNFTSSFEAILLAGFSFFLFLYNMQKPLTEDLLNEPFFWFNCGALVYFSGNILLFLLGKYLNNEQTAFLWAPIHNVLNIIFNSLIIIGFLKTKKAVPGVNKF